MGTSSKNMVAMLKFFDDIKGSVADYTEKALKKKELTVAEKMKIMHLNQDSSTRLGTLKKVQHHTFENLFKKNPDRFFTADFHYDWWVFPMNVPRSWGWQSWNYEASITLEDAKLLLTDPEFVDDYLNCIGMYINALVEHGWNEYPVRYARMLHSLSLFLQAANETQNMSIATHLHELGARVIPYAVKYVMPTNKTYELFVNGFVATDLQMKKFGKLKQAVVTDNQTTGPSAPRTVIEAMQEEVKESKKTPGSSMG